MDWYKSTSISWFIYLFTNVKGIALFLSVWLHNRIRLTNLAKVIIVKNIILYRKQTWYIILAEL